MHLKEELSAYIEQGVSLFCEPDLGDRKDEVYFTFGDLWPNSILVDLEKMSIWFIDWEAARFQRDAARDSEQLLANLWIMKQNANLFDVGKIEELSGALVSECFEGSWRLESEVRRTKFVLWALCLIKEEHWKIENKRDAMLRALEEVSNKVN